MCLYCLSVKNRCAIAPTTSGKSLWQHTHTGTSSKEEETNKIQQEKPNRKEGKEVLDCEIGTSEPSDGCDARNP
jgi:hypothetical protein